MEDVTVVISQIAELVKSHAWVPLSSLVIGLILRLSKSDATWLFLARFNIPAKARPWAALALGVASGVLEAVVAGTAWPTALVGGVVSALTAISGHQLFIESARGGKEILEH